MAYPHPLLLLFTSLVVITRNTGIQGQSIQEFMLVADYANSVIHQLDLETGDLISSINVSNPNGVVYDFTTETVLVASTNGLIRRLFLNGTGETTVYDVNATQGAFPDRIALDYNTGTIYYTGNLLSNAFHNTSFIARITSAGVHQHLVNGSIAPRDIVLDLEDQLLFWGDHSWNHIVRMELNPPSISIILSAEVVWPNGLALDYQEKRLYWTDAFFQQIGRCNYTGGEIEILASSLGHLMDISFNGEFVYYTIWIRNDSLHRFPKTNASEDIEFSAVSIGRADSIFIYSTWLLSYTSLCAVNNGGCEHNCTFDAHGTRTCSCVDGYAVSAVNNFACIVILTTCLTVPPTLPWNSVDGQLSICNIAITGIE